MFSPPLARRPQNAPVNTEPVTVRVAGSMLISASSLPLSELDTRNSRLATEPRGKSNSPTPARVVTARSALAPESRVTV